MRRSAYNFQWSHVVVKSNISKYRHFQSNWSLFFFFSSRWNWTTYFRANHYSLKIPELNVMVCDEFKSNHFQWIIDFHVWINNSYEIKIALVHGRVLLIFQNNWTTVEYIIALRSIRWQRSINRVQYQIGFMKTVISFSPYVRWSNQCGNLRKLSTDFHAHTRINYIGIVCVIPLLGWTSCYYCLSSSSSSIFLYVACILMIMMMHILLKNNFQIYSHRTICTHTICDGIYKWEFQNKSQRKINVKTPSDASEK